MTGLCRGGGIVSRNFPYYPMNEVAGYNNQFIAVGIQGYIETSKDGAIWTRQFDGNYLKIKRWVLYGVTWTGSQYVAVGDLNVIMTSPDAVNWTLRNLEKLEGYRVDISAGEHFTSVCSSGDLIVAVGTIHRNFSRDSAEIFISRDGITWSSDTYSDSVNFGVLESVIWSGSQFIAVGKGNTVDRDFAMILTSPDGANWTDRSIHSLWSGPYNLIGGSYDVIWTGKEFVAVGSVIARSADGITWNLSPLQTNMHTVQGILYDGKKYILVGYAIYLSNDAVNWGLPVVSVGFSYDNYRSIAWSGMTYVVVGSNEISYLVSP